MPSKLQIGLIIIGDEILSGKRVDQHFSNSIKILLSHGFGISWVITLCDDLNVCENFFKFSFNMSDCIVFCFGGIGSTPDDNTRQACANALGTELEANSEAVKIIREKFNSMDTPVTKERLEMGKFPVGSQIIPNPVNQIPGFHIRNHYFLPGFPKMAVPMMKWVLENEYKGFFSDFFEMEYSFYVNLLYESTITPFLNKINDDYLNLKVFSLPKSGSDKFDFEYTVELGIKTKSEIFRENKIVEKEFNQVISHFRKKIISLGGVIVREEKNTR